MATLISNASSSLTGASTFAATETGTGALALVRVAGTTNFAINASSASSTFTITNAHVIDGVLLWMKNSAAAAGTIKIALQLSGVDQASVTVNRADLPLSTNANPSPVFFKFTGTATGDGSANWRLNATLNNAGSAVTFNTNSASSSDWTRALRTTTAATAGAADDFYVVGELTGAGTNNPITVTMDQTAATVYGSGVLNTVAAAGGGIHVGKQGTLLFGTTASINYLLYVNGDVNVWDGGTLSEGTSVTPVPITSTATLKFKQNSLDGDFGLIGNDGGTINTYGVPRTLAKGNIVKCKLNADFSSTNLLASNATISVANGVNTNPLTNGVGVYNSFGCSGFVDNVTNAAHGITLPSVGTVTNTTATGRFWVARGSGTHNRFVRVLMCATASLAPTNAFYVDVDLQAGTIGASGGIGTGSITSSSIVAQDTGYLITITGIVNTSSSGQFPAVSACSALGTTSYAGDSTQCFLHRSPEVYQAASIPTQTSLTVDTDTGWLSGDLIAIASTTRTIQDCEPAVLTSNAGASTLTTTLNVLYAHSGTSPTQAEVINLTRNVKICNDSAALVTYCLFSALCTVNMQWTEVFYAGASTTTKAAITVASGTSTNPKSITYCSIHDCKQVGFSCPTTTTSANFTFSNSTLWNVAISTGPGISMNGAITLTDWTMDSNTLIRTYNSNGVTLSDVGGTFTNNTVVGAASVGIQYSEGNTIGTSSGNTAHSNGTNNVTITGQGINGTIATLTFWRAAAVGMNITGTACDLVLDTPVVFGNSGANLQFATGVTLRMISPTLSGDSSFSTTNGINIGSQQLINLKVENGNFGVASGIKTAHTNDISFASSVPIDCRAILLNTVLGSATEIATPSDLTYSGYVSSEKHDQTAGNHITWSRNGKVQTDSVIYHTASPSMRMTPTSALTMTATSVNTSPTVTITGWTNGLNWSSLYNGQLVLVSTGFASTLQTISSFSQSAGTITFGNNATSGASPTLTPFLKLESAPKDKGIIIPVASAATKTINVWVRTSVIGDGTAYNGAAPRLIQRANSAIGLTSDTVLSTFGGSAGTWTQLTATTSAASGDDGVLEFVVDCDGTAGWVNVDDWTYS